MFSCVFVTFPYGVLVLLLFNHCLLLLPLLLFVVVVVFWGEGGFVFGPCFVVRCFVLWPSGFAIILMENG